MQISVFTSSDVQPTETKISIKFALRFCEYLWIGIINVNYSTPHSFGAENDFSLQIRELSARDDFMIISS